MSEFVVDLFISVDGWAGGDGLPGFFGYDGPDLQAWVAAEKAVPEIVVMGRRTYDSFLALPPEAWRQDHDDLMTRQKIVFSRTLAEVEWPNTTILNDLSTDVPRLKRDGDLRLRTWGSMSLAHQLLAEGLVDQLRLMRFPLLAGEAGRQPAFDGVRSAELELADHRVLDGRIVLEEYRPTGRDIPRA